MVLDSMSEAQARYMVEKAACEASDEAANEYEEKWCSGHGYKDAKGKCAKHIYMIDDEMLFEKACAEIEKDGSYTALLAECKRRATALHEAEDRLIEWSLSFVPKGLRAALLPHKNEYRFRTKMIDIAFRLNPASIPGEGGRK